MSKTILLKEIQGIIQTMLRETGEMQDHAVTLVGPRTRGSTTELGIMDLDPDIELTFIGMGATPGSEIWQGTSPEMKGKYSVCSLKHALDNNIPVSVRRGLHGPELFVKWTECEEIHRAKINVCTDLLTIILGSDDTVPYQIVYTWHPGEPMDPLICSDNTAVKLDLDN